MGFFMQTFICKTIKRLKKNLNLVIIFSAVYLIGIILGVIFSSKNLCNHLLSANINNYYVFVFDVTINVFKPFFNCLLTGFLLTLVATIFGFYSFTIYLYLIVIFYKGLILGTSFILFFSLSSISGALVFLILTLPTNLIITAGLIICNVLNYHFVKITDFNKKLKKVLTNALISLLFTIIASIYFLFLLITVIRPINLLF